MIRWVWAFLDRPARDFDACVRFWATVTGTEPSDRRGADDEFLTLLPGGGRAGASVKMQAVGDGGGGGGVHLDLDVVDVPAAIRTAVGLGARLLSDHGTYAVLRSPSGQTFCLTPDRHVGEPAPAFRAPDGTFSRLDQICLDIGPSDLDGETAFWRDLTGWTHRPGRLVEFARLRADAPLPVQLLLQRLGEQRPTSAHVDLSSSDIEATAAWHLALGARIVERHAHWIVLHDPSGAPYCVTARDPHGI